MKKILLTLAFSLLVVGCSFQSTEEKDRKEETKNQSFSELYHLPEQAVFQEVDLSKVLSILENGTGVIYFGFPTCPWCQKAVPVLFDAAKQERVNEIYYFNVKEIREKPTKQYEQLLLKLDEFLDSDSETGEKTLYVPDVFFVKNGTVVGHHLGTVDSHEDPKQALTDEQYTELKESYVDNMRKLMGNE